MHNADIMLDTHENEGLHRLLCIPKGNIRQHLRLFRVSIQIHIHAERPHIILKIMQLGINKAVTV